MKAVQLARLRLDAAEPFKTMRLLKGGPDQAKADVAYVLVRQSDVQAAIAHIEASAAKARGVAA